MASNPVHPTKNKGLNSDESLSDLERIESHGNETSTPNLQKMKNIEQSALLPGMSKPKKGGFQITRVVQKAFAEHLTEDHDGDSIDDLDETNTEDISSDIIDLPKTTDIDQDPSSSDTIQSLAQEDLNKEGNANTTKLSKIGGDNVDGQSLPTSTPSLATQNNASSKVSINTQPPVTLNQLLQPMQQLPVSQPEINKADRPAEFQSTRFKVVKIESNKPFRRGRWTCLDFLDPPQKSSISDNDKSIERTLDDEKGSGNSSAASSVHYVPGVDDPAKNPFTVYSDGHTIIEPQPVRPSMVQSQLTNGVDYNSVPQNAPTSEQSMALLPSLPNATPSTAQQALVPQQVPNVANSQGLGSQSVIDSNASLSDVGNPSVQSYGGQQQGVNSAQEFAGNQPLQSHSIPQQSLGTVDYRSVKTIPQHTSSDFSLVGQVPPIVTEAPSSGGAVKSSSTSPDHEIGLRTGPDYLSGDGAFHLKLDHDKHHTDHLDITFKSLSQNSLTPPLLEMVTATMNPVMHSSNKEEDESGASTVAIDNKIEQAMDLVKSHLMFAVREEVEVLKEQIKELLEKNSQLEYENSILRSSASPETLSQLSAAAPAVAPSSQGPNKASQPPPPTTS